MHIRSGVALHCKAPCVLDTYPVMDVSTSCTSGTVSVRVLSCRASERSVLPLCGEEKKDGAVVSASHLAAGLHAPVAYINPYIPQTHSRCPPFSMCKGDK